MPVNSLDSISFALSSRGVYRVRLFTSGLSAAGVTGGRKTHGPLHPL